MRRRPGAAVRLAVGILAALAAAAFLVPKLTDLKRETADFRKMGMRDSGRIPRPLSERLVLAARREMGAGETWALHTRSGTCVRDEPLYWLAFRLMPNTADCASPDVAIYWAVAAPENARVVASGRSFVIVRP